MKYFMAVAGMAMALEGIPYFLSPAQAKRAAAMILDADETTLRIIGFVLMALGLGATAAGTM